MARPVCHLELEITPAEWAVLLSRVHHAEQLEELSLRVTSVSVHSTGTFCSCGQVCTCTFTCVLVCYVSGNRMIFGFCTISSLMCVVVCMLDCRFASMPCVCVHMHVHLYFCMRVHVHVCIYVCVYRV